MLAVATQFLECAQRMELHFTSPLFLLAQWISSKSRRLTPPKRWEILILSTIVVKNQLSVATKFYHYYDLLIKDKTKSELFGNIKITGVDILC